MALRRILLAVAGAAAFACPAIAQTQAGSYRSAGGQLYDTTGVQQITPQRQTSTVTAGTIATANTFQTALAANPTRNGCLIQNTSATVMFVYIGSGTATTAASVQLPASATFNCASAAGVVITDQIAVTSATAGAPFVAVTQ